MILYTEKQLQTAYILYVRKLHEELGYVFQKLRPSPRIGVFLIMRGGGGRGGNKTFK